MRCATTAVLLFMLTAVSQATITGTVLSNAGQNNRVVLYPVTNSVVGQADTIYGPAQWGGDWRSGGGSGMCFSPDGRRIAIAKGEWFGPFDSKRIVICVMNNDGSHVDTICLTENPNAGGLYLSWPSNDYLYWSEGSDRVYRADLNTRRREVVARLSDFLGPKPTPERIDNLKMSLDATRGAFMLNGVGFCMSLDFVTRLSRDYGAGCQGTVSPDGQLITHSAYIARYSFHQVCLIHAFESKAAVDTVYAPGAVPDGGSGPLPRIVNIRFSHSSNRHIVFSGEDALDGNGYVHDLDGTQSVLLGRCQPFDFWSGALPSPAAPYVTLDKKRLVFSAPDGASPPAQSVAVSNGGSLTLGALSFSVDPPSASWLSLTAGGSGNSRTVSVGANPAGLSAGVHTATVAVASAGAINSAVFTVTFNVSMPLNAPGSLTIGKPFQPATCVALAWLDNSTTENGFEIQRRAEGGVWATISTVAANTVRHMDTLPLVGIYEYRVRALSAGGSSGWSNEASIRVAFNSMISVSQPQSGVTWAPGSTQYIRWSASGIPSVQIKYSINDGEDWLLISGEGSIGTDSAIWGDYPWVVPGLDQDMVLIRVEEYGNPNTYGQSGYFSIRPAAAVRATPTVLNAAAYQMPLRIYGIDGRLHCGALHTTRGHGVYVVEHDGKEAQQRLRVSKRMP